MTEWLSGYAAFYWVATWSHPIFDAYFRFFTDLGYPLFYYLLIGPLFWVVDRRRTMVLFLLLLMAGLLNSEAKLFFQTPRPDPMQIRVLDMRPIQSGSASFPSGHAQIAVIFWGYLAYWASRRWFTALTVLVILSIAFSRIYLAAHYPIDVLGGLLLGIANLALMPWTDRWGVADFPMPALIRAALFLGAAALTLQSRDPAVITVGGCLMAFAALQSLPRASLELSTRAQAAAIIVAGLLLQVGAAALLGQLSPITEPGPSVGVRIGLLWLVALWAYPFAVGTLMSRRAVVAAAD